MKNTKDLSLRKVLSTMNESQTRWILGREALLRGRGGLKEVHELTGASRTTILKGMKEIAGNKPLKPFSSIRQSGGGRKDFEHYHPGFEAALEKIMAENTAGDPMCPLRWTQKSTQVIAKKLKEFNVSSETVRRKLLELNYSLQSNFKNKEGFSPDSRDEQFRYINDLVKKYQKKTGRFYPLIAKRRKRLETSRTKARAGDRRETPLKLMYMISQIWPKEMQFRMALMTFHLMKDL